MLNFIWIFLMLASVMIGSFNHHLSLVVASVTDSCETAVKICLGLAGVISLWLGLMKIAEDAGILKLLARIIQPLLKPLFPEVPSTHPAMAAIVLSVTGNLLGLGNAATPFGLKAMQSLATLNPHPGKATHAMCMFLSLHTSCIQLIPTTMIAILSLHGDPHATNIIVPIIISSGVAMCVGIGTAKLFSYCDTNIKFFTKKTVANND